MEREIRELLTRRPAGHLLETPAGELVHAVVQEMNARSVGSALVLERGALVGIFTERDALTRVLAWGRDPRATSVGAVMTPAPLTVPPSTTLSAALTYMRTFHVCHLPVVDEGAVLGVIAMRDVVEAIADDLVARARDLELENQQLQQFIQGPATIPPPPPH